MSAGGPRENQTPALESLAEQAARGAAFEAAFLESTWRRQKRYTPAAEASAKRAALVEPLLSMSCARAESAAMPEANEPLAIPEAGDTVTGLLEPAPSRARLVSLISAALLVRPAAFSAAIAEALTRDASVAGGLPV